MQQVRSHRDKTPAEIARRTVNCSSDCEMTQCAKFNNSGRAARGNGIGLPLSRKQPRAGRPSHLPDCVSCDFARYVSPIFQTGLIRLTTMAAARLLALERSHVLQLLKAYRPRVLRLISKRCGHPDSRRKPTELRAAAVTIIDQAAAPPDGLADCPTSCLLTCILRSVRPTPRSMR